MIKDGLTLPFIYCYHKIFVSCVFAYNSHRCKKWEGIAEIGGSGYDVKKKLPDAVENCKPKINYGFTSRGCVRIIRELEKITKKNKKIIDQNYSRS